MGSDAQALTELYLSDDFMELKEAAKRARQYVEKMSSQQQQHEMQLAQMKQKEDLQMHQDNMQIQREKIAGDIREAELAALGRTADREDNIDSYKIIQDAANRSLQQQQLEKKDENEKLRIQNDLQNAYRNFENKSKEIDLGREKLNVERERINAMKYVAERKNFDSTINKN